MSEPATTIRFELNGRPTTVVVPDHWTLLHTLREKLSTYDVKDGCHEGDCGACAVLLDGVVVNACLTLAVQVEGRSVTTLKGLVAQPHWQPLADAFVNCGGAQCGYCTPGMMVSAAHLLDENPAPSREEIRVAIAGNLCRCTGYSKIVDSIAVAAQKIRENGVAER